MSDYRLAAALARLELSLIRQKVDPDFLAAKMGSSEVRASAAGVDPDDGDAIARLASDVLKSIPSKFLKTTTTRGAREVRVFTAEDKARIVADVQRRYAQQGQADAQRRQLETLGVVQARKGE